MSILIPVVPTREWFGTPACCRTWRSLSVFLSFCLSVSLYICIYVFRYDFFTCCSDPGVIWNLSLLPHIAMSFCFPVLLFFCLFVFLSFSLNVLLSFLFCIYMSILIPVVQTREWFGTRACCRTWRYSRCERAAVGRCLRRRCSYTIKLNFEGML